jgi:hypothetical protein
MTCNHNIIGYCPHCDKPKRRPRRDLHHEFQVELIKHLKLHEHLHPELELIYAIPNGGKRDKVTAAKLKAEGAKSGIPDLFLPVVIWESVWIETTSSVSLGSWIKRIKWPGLYIEIKADPKDKLSDAQKWWKPRLEAQGYCYYVARDLQVTLGYILAYLRGEV